MNVSEVLTYQQCPAYWAAAWWARKRLINRRANAADIGKVVHKLDEEVMRAVGTVGVDQVHTTGATEQEWWEHNLHRLYESACAEMGLEVEQAHKRTLTAVSHRAAWWWSQRLPFAEVLAVEEEFECEAAPGVVLFGKPDSVVRDENGNVWHRQLKTYGGHHPGLKIKLIKRSLHEAAYLWLIRAKYPDAAYRGTHLTLIRTLPLREKKGGQLVKRPDAAMVVDEKLAVGPHLQARAIRDLIGTALKLVEHEAELAAGNCVPRELPQHEHRCGGAFGNSECWFLEYCMGMADLDDRMMYEANNPLEHYEREGSEAQG